MVDNCYGEFVEDTEPIQVGADMMVGSLTVSYTHLVTTGDFFTTEVDTERKLLDEVSRFNPSEIICNEAFYMIGIDAVSYTHLDVYKRQVYT